MALSCGASQQLLGGHHGTYGLLFNFPWTLAPEDGISSHARGGTELGDGAGELLLVPGRLVGRRSRWRRAHYERLTTTMESVLCLHRVMPLIAQAFLRAVSA